jgi:ABC-type amino acid transport substrate-binding protein
MSAAPLPPRPVHDSSQPYLTVYTAVLMQPGPKSNAVRKHASDLSSLSVGTVGTVDALPPHASLRRFVSVKDALAALSGGSVDAVAASSTLLREAYRVALGRLRTVAVVPTKEALQFLLPRGSLFLPSLNVVLASLSANGTLAKLTQKWFPEVQGVQTVKAAAG